MLKKIVVHVAGTSEIKIGAGKVSFGKVFPKSEILVLGYKKCPSEVNEQPEGLLEIITGAYNRMLHLIGEVIIKPDADNFFLVIENGVSRLEEDFGLVMVSGPDLKAYIGETVRVKFPHEDFVEAKSLGFDKHTVGSVMAARLGKPEVGTDPHFYLTGKHRQEYLEGTIIKILEAFYKEV